MGPKNLRVILWGLGKTSSRHHVTVPLENHSLSLPNTIITGKIEGILTLLVDRSDPNGPGGEILTLSLVSLMKMASVGLTWWTQEFSKGWPAWILLCSLRLSKEVSKMSHPASLYISCDVI